MTEVPQGEKPKFYNPFSGTKVLARGGRRPVFRAFFRSMPLHRYSLGHIQGVFEYVAVEPSRFGFPPAPTCVVNTAYLLPSNRSRSTGVYVFGSERGCKNIIIPSSCNGLPFDKLDIKMLEPIFKWNPGASYIYLSLECQTVASEIANCLKTMRNISDVTLEGWSDPIAIHKIVMACKHVELLDCYSIEDPPREWKTEAGVQALCTLIEMHPKLRGVCATRNYLLDWYEATVSSRCKHNIALIPFGDDYMLIYYMVWAFAVWIVCWYLSDLIYRLILTKLLDKEEHPLMLETAWFFVLAASFGSIIVSDIILTPKYGRSWTHLVKHYILFSRYWALRNQGKALAVVAPASVAAAKNAAAGGAAKATASSPEAAIAAKTAKFNAGPSSFLGTQQH